MFKYKVTAPLTVRSIAIQLTADQLAARSALVTEQKDDNGKGTGLYIPITEVQFKAGETIVLAEELPKAMRDRVEPVERTFFGSEANNGDDTGKEAGVQGGSLSVDQERARADHELRIREAVARGEINEEEAEKRRSETPEETKERVKREEEQKKHGKKK